MMPSSTAPRKDSLMNTTQHRPDAKRSRTRSLSFCAMATVLIVICSFITIPFVIPITLQTFAIAFILLLLGGKRGLISILLYLLLGACGLPVFHGLTGGLGILFGNTGGYLFGFIAMGLIYMIFTFGDKVSLGRKTAGLIAGLFSCYFIGTLWFVVFYIDVPIQTAITEVLLTCVIPFVLPDILKIGFAVFISGIVKKAFPEN